MLPQANERPERTLNFGRTSIVVFGLTVGAGVVNAVLQSRASLGVGATGTLIGASALYVALGTWKRVPQALGAPRYFALQLVVLTGVLLAGHGYPGLAVLPLIAQAVMAGGRRWAVPFALALSAEPVAIFSMLHGGVDFVSNVVALASAAAFVIAFTEIAMRHDRARREIQTLAASLESANAELRDAAAQAAELAAARERNRIARELHDSLGHALTIVHVELQAAAATLRTDPLEAAELLAKATHHTHEGLEDVRRSVSALRGAEHRGPFPDVIGSLVRQSAAAGMEVGLEVEGSPRPLASLVELTLFRAAQEALTNARKHAGAVPVHVRLTYAPDTSVRLRVEDRGPGARRAEGGFGLVGLRERAHLLGGTLTLSTEPGQGFTLELVLPGS